MKDGLKSLKSSVFKNPSRTTRIAEGKGTPGTRAAPSQADTIDAKIGLRLDNGETIYKDGKEYKRYKLQANKGAENPTLKRAAAHNSHEVWSQADLLIGGNSVDESVEQLFEDLEQNLEDE